MTRYMVNKALYELDMNEELLRHFLEDPWRALDSWVDTYRERLPGRPGGGVLTSEQRRWLAEVDFRSLYAYGANPFLIWQFVRSVLVPERMTIEELIVAYRRATEAFGHPDYTT